jgi:hypothetical protein
VTHGLERTNPKGEKFLGRCVYCGRENLPMSAALEPCDKAPSQDQQVLDALQRPRGEPGLNLSLRSIHGGFADGRRRRQAMRRTSVWRPPTEHEERERLIRVADSDAEWWESQCKLLLIFPTLLRFAQQQADRFREVAAALREL